MIRDDVLDPWDPVDLLKGVGPRLRDSLAEVDVERIVDLLLHLPRRYEDRTEAVPLDSKLEVGSWVLVRGLVRVTSAFRGRRRRTRVVKGFLSDGAGILPVVWFNQPWIFKRLENAGELSLYGPVREGRNGVVELVNPEVNDIAEGDPRIVPVYPRLGPFGGRRLRRLIEQSLESVDRCDDPLQGMPLDRLDMPTLVDALRRLHAPPLPEDDAGCRRLLGALNRRRTAAHRRLAFDELVAFISGVAAFRERRRARRAPVCRASAHIDGLAGRLFPFRLTGAQRRVSAEVLDDMAHDHPMARLIQGDVGSGKTAVAAIAILVALEAGQQAALMAPTELLAEQHARTLTVMFQGTPHDVKLLTGSQRAAEQRPVRAGLADGTVRLVVGTHALFQETVSFAELGLAVIDEQHRFGVAHRQALLEKGNAPHTIVMTATPIPRSLALTVYGDLDVSVIDELPPGRHPVKTVLRTASAKPRLYEFLRREIASSGRVYVVYPMIESDGRLDAPALTAHVAEVRRELPDASVDQVHGRMPAELRESVVERFRQGSVQVLLSTTVVEVGVDVPEATVMVVEGAGHFGLSQLHQLRGRVGRSDRRSWCVLLVDDEISEEARRRLDVMVSTSDGFEIAEADLEQRGPGELTGSRQWGPGHFRFADLLRHRDLVTAARETVDTLAAANELSAARERLARYHPVDVDLPTG